MNNKPRMWLPFWIFLSKLVVFVAGYPWIEPVLLEIFPGRGDVVVRATLIQLTWQHLLLVLISSALSLITGTLLGIFAVAPSGKAFRELLLDFAAFGETFPSVAIIALTVPALGYGFAPTLVALYIYGILPILRNTITGIENIPEAIMDAAKGTGMNHHQILTRIQIPLAIPVILAGVRTSVVINISAATMGALVGAGGLGVPIISGIRNYSPILILKGSVPVSLMAMAADQLLGQITDGISTYQ
jgi:osmoprotectant transport system permease protein